MQEFTIRPALLTDRDFILRVNRENVEVLSPMDENGLARFMDMASLFLLAEADGVPAAFLIALDETASGYASENYLWFRRHYERFLYIDRIVIDAPFRRSGLGHTLYREVFRFAKEHGFPCVTAEIDTIPYNKASLDFHRRMGFREVGAQSVRGGSVQVSLQVADIR